MVGWRSAQFGACLRACSPSRLRPGLARPSLGCALQGLIGVLDAAEAACGRREQLPQLLEGCIAASVEAAFEAGLQRLSANVTAGALRLAGLGPWAWPGHSWPGVAQCASTRPLLLLLTCAAC